MARDYLTAAIFPGQGVQEYLPSMSKRLLEADGDALETFEQAGKFLGMNILRLCTDGTPEELDKPGNLQPAVATACVAAIDALRRRGFRPDVLAGHSLGEYPALYTAESITLESMCRLVQARAQYMEEANHKHPGAMSALLRIPIGQVRKIAKESGVEISAENVLKSTQENIVVSGSHAALKRAREIVQALTESQLVANARERAHVIDLNIPYPAHSKRMRLAATKMRKFIKPVPIYTPTTPVIANGTGRYILTADEIRADLPRQLTKPVLWDESMRFMESEGVVAIFEVGPGAVLTGMTKKIVSSNVEVISFDPDLEEYDFSISA